jgi:hypothetical protein
MTMSGTRAIASAAALCVFVCVAAGSAFGQTAIPKPNPPPQICANGQCATTPVSKTTPASPAPTGHIKWNPGHYMASYGVNYGGRPPQNWNWEMNDLNNQDAIIGYRMMISWSALEPTPGNYDFSVIDNNLTTLKTAYNKPKHLVIMLYTYSHGAHSSGDVHVVPAYIQQDPQYGNSPVAGSYGWWGMNSNGASTGIYSPAIWYPPVANRFIAMLQAMARHIDHEGMTLDSDPYVEAIYFQEDSTIVQSAWARGHTDPHYSDAAFVTQMEGILSATTSAFAHTSVILANTWLAQPQPTVALEQWMAANRIAASSADTIGQSTFNAMGTSMLAPGLAAYIGAAASIGGTGDLRPTMTAMMDVESGDMSTTYFNKFGGPWTPLDIINALNQTYHASHAFWTRMTVNVPAAAQWPNVAATLSANPLTRTAYPADYP